VPTTCLSMYPGPLLSITTYCLMLKLCTIKPHSRIVVILCPVPGSAACRPYPLVGKAARKGRNRRSFLPTHHSLPYSHHGILPQLGSCTRRHHIACFRGSRRARRGQSAAASFIQPGLESQGGHEHRCGLRSSRGDRCGLVLGPLDLEAEIVGE
jgi:hypothetical protein